MPVFPPRSTRSTTSLRFGAGAGSHQRPYKPESYTVATLPGAATVDVGTSAMVTDGSVVHAGNSGTIVAGSGANIVPVYSDGSNWRIY